MAEEDHLRHAQLGRGALRLGAAPRHEGRSPLRAAARAVRADDQRDARARASEPRERAARIELAVVGVRADGQHGVIRHGGRLHSCAPAGPPSPKGAR